MARSNHVGPLMVLARIVESAPPEGIHALVSSTRETYPSRRTIMDGKGIPPLLAGHRAT
jgi:hypothetical protein